MLLGFRTKIVVGAKLAVKSELSPEVPRSYVFRNLNHFQSHLIQLGRAVRRVTPGVFSSRL